MLHVRDLFGLSFGTVPANYRGHMYWSKLFPALAITVLALPMVACGPSGDEPMTKPEEFQLLQPKLESIAPSAIKLGDTVRVFGSDFIEDKDGQMGLLLDGEFIDSDGDTHKFVGEIDVIVVNPSVAEFQFEEIFFHPNRDEIGTWRGNAVLVNRAPSTDDTGDNESWSTDQTVSLRVEPSMMLSRLGSADDTNCGSVSSGTNSNHNIALGFRALGFGEASPEKPWTVRMSFVTPELMVRYVVPGAFDFWPINGPLDDEVSSLAEKGNHRVEFKVDSGDSILLDPTTTARTVKVSPAVTIGQDQYSEVILGAMVAGVAPEGGKSNLNVVVEVSTDDGRVLRRVMSMDIWSELELGLWSGKERIAERYEPHAVSGCIPGGLIGGDLTYSEGETLARARAINVKWNAGVSSSLGFSGGLPVASVSGEQGWTQSFGIDTSETVTSSSHTAQNLKIQLLPSYFGMSYRQIERLERDVDVIYHNACGQSGIVGKATLSNWNFAFDVTQDKVCAPATNLPPAEVF